MNSSPTSYAKISLEKKDNFGDFTRFFPLEKNYVGVLDPSVFDNKIKRFRRRLTKKTKVADNEENMVI